MTDTSTIELTGTIAISAGHMDVLAVHGNAGPATVTPEMVSAIGLLKTYGRNGCSTVLRLHDGQQVRLSVAKQSKAAKKWIDARTAGMPYPRIGQGLDAITWREID